MKMRVEVKNRIHTLLDKYDLSHEYTDLFGKEGLEWLRSLTLPATDDQILKSNLQILEMLNEQIRNADIQIAKDAVHEEQAKLLMTMPGVDYYAAMILLSEIGDMKRDVPLTIEEAARQAIDFHMMSKNERRRD